MLGALSNDKSDLSYQTNIACVRQGVCRCGLCSSPSHCVCGGSMQCIVQRRAKTLRPTLLVLRSLPAKLHLAMARPLWPCGFWHRGVSCKSKVCDGAPCSSTFLTTSWFAPPLTYKLRHFRHAPPGHNDLMPGLYTCFTCCLMHPRSVSGPNVLAHWYVCVLGTFTYVHYCVVFVFQCVCVCVFS